MIHEEGKTYILMEEEQSPEIYPHKYSQLTVFSKRYKSNSMERVFLASDVGTIGHTYTHTKKNEPQHNLILHTKLNTKWITEIEQYGKL